MKARTVFLILASLGTIFLSFSPSRAYALDNSHKTEQDARKQANAKNTWAISEQQGIRKSSFYQYDTTGRYIYFSYSKENCVDVYDTEGTFLYCIVLPDRQNGSVGVRCSNDEVYISTKDDTVYIFQGEIEVGQLSSEEAAEKGYDFFWFYENTPHIKVDSDQISLFDHNGEMIRQIHTPRVVAQSIPKSGNIPILLILVAILILIATAFYVCISKNRVC